MIINKYLINLVRKDWLIGGPLKTIISTYIHKLECQGYRRSTIGSYLRSLAHFSFWLNNEQLNLSRVNKKCICDFFQYHMPYCTCPEPRKNTKHEMRAALNHLLQLNCFNTSAYHKDSFIDVEIMKFGKYLIKDCGVAESTYNYRQKNVRAFLEFVYKKKIPDISKISVSHIDNYFTLLALRLKPGSLKVIRSSLRSYFKFCALLGQQTEPLSMALPTFANWENTNYPKALSESQLTLFLTSFNQSDAVGLRDYAIARCLIDLGLRGQEVADLTLESINWRSSKLLIHKTKGKRVQQLPIPALTGKAIANYLKKARPHTKIRTLFVRHRAPFDIPLSVAGVRSAMNRAFKRCGLSSQYCNTHIFRHTLATRLNKSGTSAKVITDLLRHQDINTAIKYVHLDIDSLREIVLPFPGGEQ